MNDVEVAARHGGPRAQQLGSEVGARVVPPERALGHTSARRNVADARGAPMAAIRAGVRAALVGARPVAAGAQRLGRVASGAGRAKVPRGALLDAVSRV